MSDSEADSLELKPLSPEAVPAAIEKARHYRLLNEPSSAESICRDILRIESDSQETLVILILAMADQFGKGYQLSFDQILEVIGRLEDEYDRVYYTGISHERHGLAQLRSDSPGSRFMAFEWFTDAMDWYEKAEELAPDGNDDAILRWNTCARLIERNRLKRQLDTGPEPLLE